MNSDCKDYLLGVGIGAAIWISIIGLVLTLSRWKEPSHPLPPISKPVDNWTVTPGDVRAEDLTFFRGEVMSNSLTGEIWKFDEHWVRIK
jgi:hypothetical protein